MIIMVFETILSEAPSEGLEYTTFNFMQAGSELWSLSLLIPLLPYLAAFVILYVGAKKQNEKLNHNIGIIANVIAFAVALLLFSVQFFELITNGHMKTIEIIFLDWVPPLLNWSVSIGFLIDPLSTIMFTLVSFLTLLIQIYGKAYMKGEKGTKSGRYNAEISLFVGSMLLLALSANQIMFFIGWELMGLSSYLLIGFFLDKDEKNEKNEIKNAPASAAKKAFIVTKIGDVLFLAGFSLLFYFMITNTGDTVSKPLNFLQIRDNIGVINAQWRDIIALLLFGGAVGKSAQFPLHIWLPDAMEGPTTVSALIHSATMVKAGVFLVARNYYLFEGTQTLLLVGFIGAFTAILAASLAFVSDDIKRVLAYSTISQLGYMFLGLGAGSLTGGMFHLISHSFFKSLLFLGAGSVIHAVHSNDMWKMGGLKDKMPWTFRTMVVGALGLSGIIFFNGFYSKDAVILAAAVQYFETNNIIYGFMFFAGLVTALMTGFYTFRMIFTVFYSKPRYNTEQIHPHESPSYMRYPLIILGSIVIITGILSTEGLISNILSALGIIKGFTILGNLNLFNESVLEGLFETWYLSAETVIPHIPAGSEILFKIILPFTALTLAVTGIFLAYQMYAPNGKIQNFPKSVNSNRVGGVFATILKQKYYLDHLYVKIAHFIRDGVAEAVARVDSGIDYIVDRIGRKTRDSSAIAEQIDTAFCFGPIERISNRTFALGGYLRKYQGGVLQNYNQHLVVGLLIIFFVILAYFY
jgi:NADH-quinone oxidoreductase subunit L